MELSKKWKQLHNGSDLCGVSTNIKGGDSINFSPNIARYITAAFIKWLSEKRGKEENELKIAVGNDSRISGPFLKNAILKEISESGADAYDCELASTPSIFMTCIFPETQCDGSIMITAGSLTSNYNGLKLFTENGSLNEKEITVIIAIAQYYKEMDISNIQDGIVNGKIIKFDIISKYSEYLTSYIKESINSSKNREKPLEGLRIIVDASNGTGGFFADKVLKPLGANTTGSCFLEPDGNFPGHVPNPELRDSISELKKLVVDNRADFGIIFDTDVCSAGMVDKFGKIINRNRLIALMASIILEEHPNSTIVTDSLTSFELTDYIEQKLEGKHHRFKRGYKNVIDEAIRLNHMGDNSYIAIETSGHCCLKENYFFNDGAYLASKILVKIMLLKKDKKTIDSIIEDFEEPLESASLRLNLYPDNYKEYGLKILDNLKEYALQNEWIISKDNYEGVRIEFDSEDVNGWFLLRMSLHQKIMSLNIESNVKGGVEGIGKLVYIFLNNYDQINLSPLRKTLEKEKDEDE